MQKIISQITRIKTLILLVLFSLSGHVFSQDLPDPMTPPRLVNDFSSFFNKNERQALENKLLTFNNRTSTQIYVVTVNSLNGYDKADYAARLGEKWEIGQAGKDNGLLILIKPKSQSSKGEVFIATGYGMESVVPDAVAKRIVENEIIPSFKQGAYFQGIDKAVNVLQSLALKEFPAQEYMEKTKQSSAGSAVGGIFFFIFMIILFFGSRGRSRHYGAGRRSSLPFWLLMGMMGSGNSHRGSFGDFSSGGGSFGGFGGFGGGGGGSFGGGGAGGSW